MKKSKMFVIIVGVFLILIIALICTNNINKNNVVMDIKKETISKTGATIILKNNSDNIYEYGEEFVIEKKENGEWQKLEYLNGAGFIEPAYELGRRKERELKIDWSNIYGELEEGTYRFSKEISGTSGHKDIWVEFTIKE